VIYLDSCLLIYAIEDAGDRGHRARVLINEHEAEGLVISPLVKLECLVGPLRAGGPVIQHRYERAFSELTSVPMGDSIFTRAAQLRAEHRLTTPDTLHLAAALMSGCDALWTNDRRLVRAVGDFAIAIV
jgi:uncharacterized protein